MKVFSRFTSSACVLITFFMFASAAARGQLTTAEEKGLPPNSTFSGGDIDAVNLQNGNLHISIPIASVKQRGGTTLSWNFVYDTPSWVQRWSYYSGCGSTSTNSISSSASLVASPSGAIGGGGGGGTKCNPRGYITVNQAGERQLGWRLSSPLDWDINYSDPESTQYCTIVSPKQPYHPITNWSLTDPQGTSHALPLRQDTLDAYPKSSCNGQTLKGPALDGSGIVYDSQANVIYLKDGTQISGGNIRDANGNIMTSTKDTLNRSPVTVVDQPTTTYTTPSGNTAYGPQYTTYTVSDSSGNPQVFRVDYEAIDILSDICTASLSPTGIALYPCTEYRNYILVPSRLTLPTGKAYVFTYNNGSPGELAKIDLPTGGSISYTYTHFFQTKRGPLVASQQPGSVVLL